MNPAIGEAGNSKGFDMAPKTTLDVVKSAIKQIPNQMPPGPGNQNPAFHQYSCYKNNTFSPGW
jgi:hypothetical protein